MFYLSENRRNLLSSKQTKHINNRYYFIKDVIEHNEVKIEYKPTKEMVADFFTSVFSPFLC